MPESCGEILIEFGDKFKNVLEDFIKKVRSFRKRLERFGFIIVIWMKFETSINK